MPEEVKPRPEGGKNYGNYLGNALEVVQVALYLIAALFLIAMAVMAFYVVVTDLGKILQNPSSILAIDNALVDLLVIFIITGLIQTLAVFINTRVIDPGMVLCVGLTAIIRRVLVFGAQDTPYEELALTAVLLLVIVIGLYLINRMKQPRVQG